MKSTRRTFSLGIAGFALATAGLPRAIAAQDSSPEAADMGNAMTALGIGGENDAAVNVIQTSTAGASGEAWITLTALTGLAFGVFSGWVALPAGELQEQVTAEGGDQAEAVIDAMVTLEAGAAYRVAATGLLENIAPQIYQVDLSTLADDTARVRVIHTSPDAPAVDVAVTGGDVLIENLEFPNASDFLEVPAGTYDLEVRPTGTENVALALPGVELEDSLVYDVFAIGTLADETLSVLVVPSTTVAPEATPAA